MSNLCPSALAEDRHWCQKPRDHKGKCREIIELADGQEIVLEWWFRKAKAESEES